MKEGDEMMVVKKSELDAVVEREDMKIKKKKKGGRGKQSKVMQNMSIKNSQKVIWKLYEFLSKSRNSRIFVQEFSFY